MSGYKYDWTCPNCGTYLQLKMRVTQTKRKCPHCGFRVTPEEIDRQAWYRGVGCLIIIGLVWLLCTVPAGTIAGLFQGLIYFIVGLAVIAVIAFVVYVSYKVYDNRRSESKKSEFLDSSDYGLIRDFARSEMIYEEGTHEKLHTLLQQRGWDLPADEINSLVEKESEDFFRGEQTKWITDQIGGKNPTNRDAYISAYIELSHPHEDEYIHVLAGFLKVAESDYPKLREEITRFTTRAELGEFERKLRDGTLEK